MAKRKKQSKPKKEEIYNKAKNYSEDYVDIEIEKNFFIRTHDPDRSRLEKWHIGRRNFS